MAKKIVGKLKIQFREETRLKNRNLSETKADIHVGSVHGSANPFFEFSVPC